MSAPSDAWAWLEARTPDIPEPLRTRLRETLSAGAAGADIAMLFGDGALACLRRALAAGDDRAAALDLLAADALLTHGAEAAAASGAAALDAFAERFGAAALGRRFLTGAT